MVQYSALRCVSGIWQNNEKLLISNGLRSVVTYLLTVALWVLFHCSRHSAATLAITAGAELYSVSKILGYGSIASTQVYAKVNMEKKVEVMSLTDGVFG